MKHVKISGGLLKCLILAALLTACNNEQEIIPASTADVVLNDHNAKINAELRLVKEGGISLQYVKSGRFTGKISRASASGYTIEYKYDSNPSGQILISRKLYDKPTNQLIEDYKYVVVNGLCIAAEDIKHNVQYQYKYNAQQLLQEVKWGNTTETYTYGYSFATKSYRLAYVHHVVQHMGKMESMRKFDISYTAINDKYPMNPQLMPFNGIDRYLPIYGKFSDVLPSEIHENVITPNGDTLEYHDTYTYGLNGNGYVVSKTKTSAGDPTPSTLTFSYSSNWQGIP